MMTIIPLIPHPPRPMKKICKFFFFFAFAIFLSTQASAKESESNLEEYGFAKLRALDKITARTDTFTAKVGEVVQSGPLNIQVRACRKSSPIDPPRTAAFIQIWEKPPKEEDPEWVFSGWMFAGSPGLSSMDHAVYDVWVLDCLNDDNQSSAGDEPNSGPSEE